MVLSLPYSWPLFFAWGAGAVILNYLLWLGGENEIDKIELCLLGGVPGTIIGVPFCCWLYGETNYPLYVIEFYKAILPFI